MRSRGLSLLLGIKILQTVPDDIAFLLKYYAVAGGAALVDLHKYTRHRLNL